MKHLILLSLFCVSTLTYAQIDVLPHDLISKEVNSIQFSIWEMQTKELSTPDNLQEYEKELQQVPLTKKDQELFLNTILDSKSYDQSRALLYHYNVMFQIQYEDSTSTEIRISTMTGNVYIDTTLNETHFRNNCSEHLGKVIYDFLKRYDFLTLIDEIELEGLK